MTMKKVQYCVLLKDFEFKCPITKGSFDNVVLDLKRGKARKILGLDPSCNPILSPENTRLKFAD